MRILYLFPDTNLFIQCHPLESIGWSEWKDFDEIHLIVCRPVQREIDNQKNRGNDRVGKRARTAYSLFRDIICGEREYKLLQETDPRVQISLDTSNLPSNELSDRLDYQKPDDEIIGHIHRYSQEHTDLDIRLLTHDSGLMATAKSLDIKFIPIRDNWLLPPEKNETEKENMRLGKEIAQLKKREPQFRIMCLDDKNNETDYLEYKHPVYEPLDENAVSKFINLLRDKFPIAMDFGPRERDERVLRLWKEVYKPAKDKAIVKYRDQEYPAWIEDCKKVLSNLHNVLQRKKPLMFSFVGINEGTRPGKDVLVIISAKGDFKICPPKEDEENDEDTIEQNLFLPKPPRPPKGEWKRESLLDCFAYLDQLSSMPNSPSPVVPSISFSRHSELHDPNGFYYKPKRPLSPVKSFELECEQWRHRTGNECFEGEIFIDGNDEGVQGALECEIHAENLSSPIKKTIPIKIIVTKSSTEAYAFNLVTNLSHSTDE